nr:zinc finger CCCH domain-containing protein 48-like [Tanacetum cinerariifolium]
MNTALHEEEGGVDKFTSTDGANCKHLKTGESIEGIERIGEVTGCGTCTYIASQIFDATTKLTSHYHHCVWNVENLHCLQTLMDNTSVATSILCWVQFLLSCSLDKTIKLWADTYSGTLEVTYTHSEEHQLCNCHYCRHTHHYSAKKSCYTQMLFKPR